MLMPSIQSNFCASKKGKSFYASKPNAMLYVYKTYNKTAKQTNVLTCFKDINQE